MTTAHMTHGCWHDRRYLPAIEIIVRWIVEDLDPPLSEFEAVAAALDAASGVERTR